MPSTVTNDANSVLPLLFAAHPEIKPNYHRMAALDDLGRTQSALEHKFRGWRQEGRKILAEKGQVGNAESTPKKNKAAAIPKKAASMTGAAGEKHRSGKVFARKLMTAQEAQDEGDETEEDDSAENARKFELKASRTKPSELDTSKHDSLILTPKARNAVGNPSTPPSKKRAAPHDSAEISAGETAGPIKKARIAKKGVARRLPQPARKPHESDETVTSSEAEEEVDGKGKGKAGKKAESKKPVAKARRGRSNAISGSSPKVSVEIKNEEPGDEAEEGLVEMGFDAV